MAECAGQLLVVEYQSVVRPVLKTTLTAVGFTTEEVCFGEEMVRFLRNRRYEAVLLDLNNIPRTGAFKTCSEVRALAPAVSIFVLSDRNSQDDKVAALDAGAEDYITKPFHIPELVARLRCAVRRSRLFPSPTQSSISIGEIELDPARRTAKKANQPVHLTPKEFKLLHHLMAHAGLPVTHTELLRTVWTTESQIQLQCLRTIIHDLRLKLEDNPAKPIYLVTEPCIGYRFRSAG